MHYMDKDSINAIKVLSADSVQKANSGHPGLPLGSAPMAYELWSHHMKHNPKNPNWANRDRFVLSGGHGSVLLYSLLHLFGCGLQIEDLKNFRQLGSLTPGHPEYGHTVGVEATTGPLGAGMAMAVGMAMAEKHLASIFNTDDYSLVDHHTFVLGGDGCMMEGITYEAFSLAGTLGLDKLIVLYDSNNITIEGSTDLAFTEDLRKRFEAFGFQTLVVENGCDTDAISIAIEKAKNEKNKPSFIEVKTLIGAGCPDKEGKASAHGEPLGESNVLALRNNIGWKHQEEFFVPDDIYNHFKQLSINLSSYEDSWNILFDEYSEKYPEKKLLWDKYHNLDIATILDNNHNFWNITDVSDATRNISGKIINEIKDIIPNLFGGAADLSPSTKTYMNNQGDFSSTNPSGRNLHFGVRELAMAGIGNGIALHGGLKPFVSTFFVFSDYVKPMARLSSLMNLPITYVFTHDSIGVGEDGPTHEPIEQLATYRATPNFYIFRPADATETAASWFFSLTKKDAPTGIVLTRQNLPQLKNSSKEALKGAYILEDSAKEQPDAIIIATGSEVELALEAKAKLLNDNIDVRVVSMPCMDLFEDQSSEYKNFILPSNITARVAVEALTGFGWGKYIGLKGEFVGMNSFGASAPGDLLFKHFNITADAVVTAVKKTISC